MVGDLTRIIALLTLCTLLVTLLGVGVVSINRGEAEKFVPLVCGTPFVVNDPPFIDHPGRTIFEANCTACHAVNQVVVGPALRGIGERRDSLWIVRMIRNSEQLIASGDSTATKLYREYNQTRMPSYQSLPDSSIQLMIEYLDLETQQQLLAVPVAMPSAAW